MVIYKESIGKSKINLIFVIVFLLENLISYGIAEELDHDSDHLSILSQ